MKAIFTEKELVKLYQNNAENYITVYNKIEEVGKGFSLINENDTKEVERLWTQINRLHQQALICSNAMRKYAKMLDFYKFHK